MIIATLKLHKKWCKLMEERIIKFMKRITQKSLDQRGIILIKTPEKEDLIAIPFFEDMNEDRLVIMLSRLPKESEIEAVLVCNTPVNILGSVLSEDYENKYISRRLMNVIRTGFDTTLINRKMDLSCYL